MRDEKKPGSYRDLLVWQKGIALVVEIYQLTRAFPADERFGLTAQMRRAAVSVPSNIAEGHARRTTGECIQFISIAEGSLAELDTQLVIAIRLGDASDESGAALATLIIELRRMLNTLRRKLAGR
jgi:four helix bundle protein